MNRLLLVSSSIALPTAASAQRQETSRWVIGAGAAAIDSPDAGEDIRIRPNPLLSYEGRSFSFALDVDATTGHHVLNTRALRINFHFGALHPPSHSMRSTASKSC